MQGLYAQGSKALSTVSSAAETLRHKAVLAGCNRVTIGTTLRVYNAVLAAAVFADYMNKPEASSSEYLFDIAVHALQATVSDDSPDALKKAAECMNALRLFFIGYYQVTGTSTIPGPLRFGDIFNHSGNLLFVFTSKNPIKV